MSYSPSFGGDSSFKSFKSRINYYHQLSDKMVLAGRLSYCSVSGQAPVFELCQLGQGTDLRGYPGGKYRDDKMLAAQAEYRWRFYKIFGLVLFAGLGSVAPRNEQILGKGKMLHSVGAGLRYLASEAYGVNLSMDIAFGKNSRAFYFRVGEAF